MGPDLTACTGPATSQQPVSYRQQGEHGPQSGRLGGTTLVYTSGGVTKVLANLPRAVVDQMITLVAGWFVILSKTWCGVKVS